MFTSFYFVDESVSYTDVNLWVEHNQPPAAELQSLRDNLVVNSDPVGFRLRLVGVARRDSGADRVCVCVISVQGLLWRVSPLGLERKPQTSGEV